MERTIIKGFVKSWTDTHVRVICLIDPSIDHTQLREFERDHMFKGYPLFKGMNVWLGMEMKPGQMTARMNVSDEHWLKQKWNYWWLKDFLVDESNNDYYSKG